MIQQLKTWFLLGCFLIGTPEAMAESSTLRVALFDLKPFASVEQGRPTGLIVDLVKEIFSRTDLKYTIQVLPYPRLREVMKRGHADVAIHYAANDPQKHIEIIGYTLGNQNIILPRAGLKIEKLEDLHRKTVAIIDSAKYDKRFDQDPLILKMNVLDYETGYKLVKFKRADAMIISSGAYALFVKQADYDPKWLSKPFILNYKANALHVRSDLDDTIKKKLKTANKAVLAVYGKGQKGQPMLNALVEKKRD